MDEEEKLSEIDRLFRELDKNNDKQIDIKELEQFVLNQGLQMTRGELQHLIESIDVNKDGKINKKEFKAVTKEMYQSNPDDTILRQVFDIIDREHDGVISEEELKYALYCLGERVSDEDVRHLISFANSKTDCKYVTFEDFKKVAGG